MEFEQRLQITPKERPWVRTCWSIYDGLSFEALQKEYRRLAEDLAAGRVDRLDIGCTSMLLKIWGEKSTEESALDCALARKESQLNYIGLRLEQQYLLATDSIHWFR